MIRFWRKSLNLVLPFIFYTRPSRVMVMVTKCLSKEEGFMRTLLKVETPDALSLNLLYSKMFSCGKNWWFKTILISSGV